MKNLRNIPDILEAWNLFREEFALLSPDENQLLQKARIANSWFIPAFSRVALEAADQWMNETTLMQAFTTHGFKVSAENNGRLGIIAAGNIPAVGLHDLVCGLLSGMEIDFKAAASDNVLIPRFIELVHEQNQALVGRIKNVDFLSGDYHAFIGTGSNNTNRYFREKYKTIPSLLRHHRNSLAWVVDSVSDEQLALLADDVFLYYGLGCRNVSLVFVPVDFDLNRLINAFHSKYPDLMNFSRYADAVKYYRSYFSLMQEPCWDAGFMLMRQGARLDSPVGCLNIVRYSEFGEVDAFINEHQDDIQCVVGNACDNITNTIYGKSQFPAFLDFADGIDTLEFLNHVR